MYTHTHTFCLAHKHKDIHTRKHTETHIHTNTQMQTHTHRWIQGYMHFSMDHSSTIDMNDDDDDEYQHNIHSSSHAYRHALEDHMFLQWHWIRHRSDRLRKKPRLWYNRIDEDADRKDIPLRANFRIHHLQRFGRLADVCMISFIPVLLCRKLFYYDFGDLFFRFGVQTYPTALHKTIEPFAKFCHEHDSRTYGCVDAALRTKCVHNVERCSADDEAAGVTRADEIPKYRSAFPSQHVELDDMLKYRSNTSTLWSGDICVHSCSRVVSYNLLLQTLACFAFFPSIMKDYVLWTAYSFACRIGVSSFFYPRPCWKSSMGRVNFRRRGRSHCDRTGAWIMSIIHGMRIVLSCPFVRVTCTSVSEPKGLDRDQRFACAARHDQIFDVSMSVRQFAFVRACLRGKPGHKIDDKLSSSIAAFGMYNKACSTSRWTKICTSRYRILSRFRGFYQEIESCDVIVDSGVLELQPCVTPGTAILCVFHWNWCPGARFDEGPSAILMSRSSNRVTLWSILVCKFQILWCMQLDGRSDDRVNGRLDGRQVGRQDGRTGRQESEDFITFLQGFQSGQSWTEGRTKGLTDRTFP